MYDCIKGTFDHIGVLWHIILAPLKMSKLNAENSLAHYSELVKVNKNA